LGRYSPHLGQTNANAFAARSAIWETASKGADSPMRVQNGCPW
jgi:hypothetical protein